jgi:hypothetical protein
MATALIVALAAPAGSDHPWAQMSGTFSAELDFTVKPDELFAAWDKPGKFVPVGLTDVVHRNEVIVGIIFFSGCKPDKRGNCETTVDFRMLWPDGTVHADLKDNELWRAKPAPKPPNVELCVQPLIIKIGPADPLGKYTVEAVVHDGNGSVTLHLTRTFSVEETH